MATGIGKCRHALPANEPCEADPRTLDFIARLIEEEKSAVVEETKVIAESEYVFLGLRLTKGINLEKYKNLFNVDLREEYKAGIERLEEFDLVEFRENHLRLTTKGMLYSNEVFAVFV